MDAGLFVRRDHDVRADLRVSTLRLGKPYCVWRMGVARVVRHCAGVAFAWSWSLRRFRRAHHLARTRRFDHTLCDRLSHHARLRRARVGCGRHIELVLSRLRRHPNAALRDRLRQLGQRSARLRAHLRQVGAPRTWRRGCRHRNFDRRMDKLLCVVFLLSKQSTHARLWDSVHPAESRTDASLASHRITGRCSVVARDGIVRDFSHPRCPHG